MRIVKPIKRIWLALVPALLLVAGCQNTQPQHSQLVAQIEHDQRAHLFRACAPTQARMLAVHGRCADAR